MDSGSRARALSKLLLTTIYRNAPELELEVAELIDAGAPVSDVSEYGESPLRVASNNGRFGVVRLLLDAGADGDQLSWTPTFHAVAFGTLDDIRASAERHDDLEARDRWSRTPWLMSLQTGDVDKASLLLELGADPSVVGRCAKVPMAYAVQHDDVAMLRWLIDEGFDIEATDEFLNTPLIDAAEHGATHCVRVLLDAGADIAHHNHIPERAIEVASNLEIVELLLAHGEDINAISDEMHARLLGVEHEGVPDVGWEAYRSGRRRRFGQRNPERIDEPFWYAMIRSGASAWTARGRFDDTNTTTDTGPVWCYSRFGRSTTLLPDRRIIEIGGEHEDHYDPDFCIYNDVTVFGTDGRIDCYVYPRVDFTPTDFHSATLVGNRIIVIGGLGYPEDRVLGYTPVYSLCVDSLRIEHVSTSGQGPGWIHGHVARYDGIASIVVLGGEVMSAAGQFSANDARYRLDLGTGRWRREA